MLDVASVIEHLAQRHSDAHSLGGSFGFVEDVGGDVSGIGVEHRCRGGDLVALYDAVVPLEVALEPFDLKPRMAGRRNRYDPRMGVCEL